MLSTGLEVLAEFPGQGMEPLITFKSWWNEAHKNLAMPPGSKLREKFRKLKLPENFPSDRIHLAYMNPEIDNSLEKFSWAIPNFVDIRDYASDKFGWTKGKIFITHLFVFSHNFTFYVLQHQIS